MLLASDGAVEFRENWFTVRASSCLSLSHVMRQSLDMTQHNVRT